MIHDRTNGYLRNKTAEDLAEERHRLAELQPEDVPADCIFLLEVDSGKLTKEHVETQAYWVVAMKAARKAKAAQSAKTATEKKRSKRKTSGRLSSKVNLGVTEVEREIIRDRINNQGGGERIISGRVREEETSSIINCKTNEIEQKATETGLEENRNTTM
jgi:hypothetical protein